MSKLLSCAALINLAVAGFVLVVYLFLRFPLLMPPIAIEVIIFALAWSCTRPSEPGEWY